MSKKVLILSSSPRRGGNSDTLCNEFVCGAMEAGNEVEKIFLRNKIKYYLTTCLMAMTLLVTLTSCSTDDPVPISPETGQPAPPANPEESGNDDNNNPMSNNLKINVGSASFNVTLENNATVTAFKALLPMTVNMSEMNGNEKYYYLPKNLPTASSNPGTIQTGDLMLYGSSCLVLFYESLRTSYSYTRLGRVDNPSGLASALGSGNTNVTFELQ